MDMTAWPSYPWLSSLMHAQNCLFLDAQIEHTMIWISSWKLYFSPLRLPGLEVGRHGLGALAGSTISCTSFCTVTGLRRGRFAGGQGTILPCCWRRSDWRLRRWSSLVEFISFDDAPPAGLVQAKHRCTVQAHVVDIEVAQQTDTDRHRQTH